MGFEGQFATDQVKGDKVILPQETLNILDSGKWKVKGLVRNETIFLVKNIEVEAVLYDENGKILDEVNGYSKIKNIRPGEPAPVVLESDVETSKVKRVEWNVKIVETSAVVDRDGIVLIAGVQGLQTPGSAIPLYTHHNPSKFVEKGLEIGRTRRCMGESGRQGG